ncbi:uncharacterized protein LOC143154780 [Ptiloglossa arizonensis]|uniref:uncharacterized protein LOC143154780 n=1 Tax=Ptiloglossa arizonensis TaxID=3350558 RepID=UPI003FA13270
MYHRECVYCAYRECVTNLNSRCTQWNVDTIKHYRECVINSNNLVTVICDFDRLRAKKKSNKEYTWHHCQQFRCNNYLVWAMKMEATVSIRRTIESMKEEKPKENALEKTMAEQALQFVREDNARDLWLKIKKAYMGAAEDQKIDALVTI